MTRGGGEAVGGRVPNKVILSEAKNRPIVRRSFAPLRMTLFVLLTAFPPTRLPAQVVVHGQAIPLVTRASHTPGDEILTE